MRDVADGIGLKGDSPDSKKVHIEKLTQSTALQAYAKMLNTLDTRHFEDILPEDFIYESQYVLQPLESKQDFLNYMTTKLQTIARTKATVFAEMGVVSAYGSKRPCVILAQNKKDNLVGLALAKVNEGKLKRLDLCIAPSPKTAERSGEYPK